MRAGLVMLFVSCLCVGCYGVTVFDDADVEASVDGGGDADATDASTDATVDVLLPDGGEVDDEEEECVAAPGVYGMEVIAPTVPEWCTSRGLFSPEGLDSLIQAQVPDGIGCSSLSWSSNLLREGIDGLSYACTVRWSVYAGRDGPVDGQLVMENCVEEESGEVLAEPPCAFDLCCPVWMNP